MTRIAVILAFVILSSCPSRAQDALLNRADVQEAMAHIEAEYERFVDKQIQISEIPAPPFKEEERAAFMAAEFDRLGLTDVHIDEEGNVYGQRAGASERVLVVSAHVDTVFPEGTDVTVRREGAVLHGPGIVDDVLGLSSLLGLIESLDEAGIETDQSLLFMGTVGEEGLGDLRGVKYLFNEHPIRDRIDGFISIDGSGMSGVTHGALGSKRYRITVKGPGGHSWGSFGDVNPAHALGQIIARFTSMPAPIDPRTSYNVGRIGGGTSINSIPFEVWMEVDMRSYSNEALLEIEALFLETVQQGIDAENLFRKSSATSLTVDIEKVGDRPSGTTDENEILVRAAMRATSAMHEEPTLSTSSTDSNIPISLGIPAITIGGGGVGTGSHSLHESFDTTDAYLGLQRILLTVLAYDEMKKEAQ